LILKKNQQFILFTREKEIYAQQQIISLRQILSTKIGYNNSNRIVRPLIRRKILIRQPGYLAISGSGGK